MTILHIIAGLLALAAGAVALSATKGSLLHRRSGWVFVVAMLAMTSSAVLIATLLNPNRVNVVAGTLTAYLVCTGLLTVRPPVPQVRGLLAALMVVALVTGGYAFTLAIEALGNANGLVDKVPAPPLVMFGTVGIVAGLLDARLLHAGGGIHGAHRIARHLWRMGFAMWIATMSFFLGQAKLFPMPVRESGVLAVPVALVTLALLWSLGRVLLRRHRLLRERGLLG